MILLKHLHTVSLLLSNNKSLYNLHPLIELFFVPAFHLHFSNSCQVLSAIAPCSLIVFLSGTAENRTEWLTINLIAASLFRVLGLWCGTPSEFPFSPLVSTSMSLSKSAHWSSVSCSFLVTDVSQSAADLGDSVSCYSIHFHGLAVIGIWLSHSLVLSLPLANWEWCVLAS